MVLSKRISLKMLRSGHWYELVCLESGMNNTKLNCYPGNRANANLAADWEQRQSVVQKRSVDRLRPATPLSSFWIENAPYELLSNSELSSVRLEYLSTQGFGEPVKLKGKLSGQTIFSSLSGVDSWMLKGSSTDLVRRGDLLAFFTILARVRAAEAAGNSIAHIIEISNLYRCMPGLGRYEWLRRDFGLLCDLVELIHHRVELTRDQVGVDWDILMTQFNDPDYEPDPNARNKDPETGQPLAIADPIQLAKAINRGVRPSLADGGEPKHYGTPFDGGYFKDLSYRQICRMHTDQLLFMAYMQTAHLWGVLRSDWEAVLGVSSSELKHWLEVGVLELKETARHRILTISVIREWLSLDSDYRNQCAENVSQLRDDLDGQSIHQRLRSGGTMDLLKLIPKSAAKKNNGTAPVAIFPLVSIPS